MPQLKLNDIPADVQTALLKIQADKKIEKKSNMYSLEKTVYAIVREYVELKKLNLT